MSAKLLLAVSLVTLPLHAGLITGVSIHSVSSEYTLAPWDLRAIHVVDGSGLSGSPAGHAVTDTTGNSWQTYTQSGTGDIQFDLGGIYNLSTVHVWNLNFGSPYNGRGANHVAISTSANGATWNSEETVIFAQASGVAGDLGFDVSAAGWQATRYIDFQILDNHGGSDNAGHVGLSEVRFYSSDVPEPSSVALSVLGFVALLLRRLRRSC